MRVYYLAFVWPFIYGWAVSFFFFETHNFNVKKDYFVQQCCQNSRARTRIYWFKTKLYLSPLSTTTPLHAYALLTQPKNDQVQITQVFFWR